MKKVRILVVEDEVLIRKYLIRYLEFLNCKIIGDTGYGEKAVEIALKEKPDLVCMDIKLQGVMNGIEAAKKISESDEIPIVFISAYDYEDEVNKLNLNNILGFIEKPIPEEKLELIINEIKQKK